MSRTILILADLPGGPSYEGLAQPHAQRLLDGYGAACFNRRRIGVEQADRLPEAPDLPRRSRRTRTSRPTSRPAPARPARRVRANAKAGLTHDPRQGLVLANRATGGVGVSGVIGHAYRSVEPIVAPPLLGLIRPDSVVAKAVARSKPRQGTNAMVGETPGVRIVEIGAARVMGFP